MSFKWRESDYRRINFQDDVPKKLQEYDCKPFNMRLPVSKNWKTSKNRAVVVLTHIPSEELRSKDLMSLDESQTIFENIVNESQKWATKFDKPKDFDYAFINFNSYSDYHLKKSRYENSQRVAAKRVRKFIKKLQPNLVIVFGTRSAEYILKKENLFSLQGKQFTLKIKDFTVPLVHSLDFNQMYTSQGDGEFESSNFRKYVDKSNLLGYTTRCLATGFLNKRPIQMKLKPKAKFISNMKQFRSLYTKLKRHRGPLACDTETDNLNVIDNRILTIQFAMDEEVGYVLPLYHKQSPFSPKELMYIKKKLSKFFNRKPEKYDDVYFLFQNGIFDIPLIRREFNVPCFHYSVYDTIAGEFCLDENIGSLILFKPGLKAWALDTLFERYGCEFFRTAKFGKGERANIRNSDLNDDVILYCAVDVQGLIALHNVQMKVAENLHIASGNKDRSYKPFFKRFVLLQMSAMIKAMSEMRLRGIPVDPVHLMFIRSSNSPVLKIREDEKKRLYDMKSCKKANELLLKEKGVPKKGLFGNTKNWIFNIEKDKHKRVLYFDVLGLEPVGKGKKGGKLDKTFQKKYADEVEEVAILQHLNKLKVLYSTFCKGLYSKYVKNADMRIDGNLRPGYGYADVLTGRSNSFKPSLQQIPEHSKEAKYVKRIFISRKGEVIIKLDYSAHEIRCWGLISRDDAIAEVFKKAMGFILSYRVKPTEKKKALLKPKSDVHRLNYELFTGVPAVKVSDEQRQSSKGITFGSMYGMSVASLAKSIKQSLEKTKEILGRFFKKFIKASKWLEWAKDFSAKNFYVFSPLGRRRNLSGYMTGAKSIYNALQRRAVNSPIQGMASDFGFLAANLIMEELCKYHAYLVSKGVMELTKNGLLPFGLNKMVHDSIEIRVPYAHFMNVMRIMEYCTTTGVREFIESNYGMKFVVDLGVDFEIGATGDTMAKWDYSRDSLISALKQTLDVQKKELKHEINRKKTLKSILKGENSYTDYMLKHYPLPVDKYKEVA